MPTDIGRDKLKHLQAQGAAVVEVLPSKQFEEEHLPSAISLPLGDLTPLTVERKIGPDKHRSIVVYCQGVD